MSRSSDHEEEQPAPAIRSQYQEHGVEGYYAARGERYRNPHQPQLTVALTQSLLAWQLDLSHVLDLACGAGEATLVLQSLGAGQITGIDPYTAAAYHEQTGLTAEPISFEQIAAGAIRERRFSLIVCSYALHLLEPSRLPGLLSSLAQLSDALVIATPHKRPQLKPAWGWTLMDERMKERVRTRLYRQAPVADPLE